MPYQPIPVEQFGGLDLRDDPGEAGLARALIAKDVEIDNGEVRARRGYSSLVTVAGSKNAIDAVQINDSLAVLSTSGSTCYLDVIDNALGQANVGGFGASTSGVTAVARLGTPTVQAIYLAFGSVHGWAKAEYTGSWSITSPISGAKPAFIALTPWDNRLVMANFADPTHSPTGSNGSPSTIFLSDPGAPSTFTATNYVHLEPGNGEDIRAVVPWRDLMIVFKESRAYVFTQPTQAGDGSPVFPYRTIPLGTQLDRGNLHYRTAIAGPDGVYFVSVDGIFMTDGFSVRKVSDALDPIFSRSSVLRGTSYELDHGLAFGKLSYTREGMFYKYTNLSGDEVLLRAFDGEWAQWDTIAERTLPFDWNRPAGGQEIWFGHFATLARYEPLTTTDGGGAVMGKYATQPFIIAGGERATVRELEVVGYGTPTVSVAIDRPADPLVSSFAAPLTLGTYPANAAGMHRVAYNGTTMQVALSGGAWGVQRAVLHVRETQAGAR